MPSRPHKPVTVAIRYVDGTWNRYRVVLVEVINQHGGIVDDAPCVRLTVRAESEPIVIPRDRIARMDVYA
jgi:hypothetical protein